MFVQKIKQLALININKCKVFIVPLFNKYIMKHQQQWQGFQALNDNEEKPSNYHTIPLKEPPRSYHQSSRKTKKTSQKSRIDVSTENNNSPLKFPPPFSQKSQKEEKQKQKISKVKSPKFEQKLQTKEIKKIRYAPIPIIYEKDNPQNRGKAIYRGLLPRTSDNYFRLLKDVNWSLPLYLTAVFNRAIQPLSVRYFWVYLRVSSKEYDLYMRFDTNTNGHMQWFYFSIKNTKIIKLKLNIFRFKKRYSLFQRGFRPFIRSRRSGKDWLPGGQSVKYLRQCAVNQNGVKTVTRYYYLTFTYNFQYQNDEVYFAACIPYTTTLLTTRLSRFQETFSLNQRIKFEIKTLCSTICGQQIQLLSIEPYQDQNNLNKKKNFIVINARSHPGETSGSWVMDGFLQNLAENLQIQQWMVTMNICFRIIPMLNKDGVFIGNYRTGIVGDDFNRKFATGPKEYFPEIHALKKLVAKCKKAGNLRLFLDLHGHSILKNSFIFGPEYQCFQNYKLIQLGDILSQRSKYFSEVSSYYRNQRYKFETARVFFQFQEEILSLTCQNSLGLFTEQYQTFQQTMNDWKTFGIHLLQAMKSCFTQPHRFRDPNLLRKHSQNLQSKVKQLPGSQLMPIKSSIQSKNSVDSKFQNSGQMKRFISVSIQKNKTTNSQQKQGKKPFLAKQVEKVNPNQSKMGNFKEQQLQKSVVLSRYGQSKTQAIQRSQRKSKMFKPQELQDGQINQLGIQQQIPDNFSQMYESMNDSDSQTDDIDLSKREELFRCIKEMNIGLINENSLEQMLSREQLQPVKGFRQYKLNFEPQTVSLYDKKPITKLKPLKFQEYKLRGFTEKKIKGNIDLLFGNRSLITTDRQKQKLNCRKNEIISRKYKETKKEQLLSQMFPKTEEKEYLLMRIKEITLQKGKQLEK